MAMIVALTLMLGSSISAVSAGQTKSNPLAKVLELVSALEVKIIREGEREAAAYNEFFEWCDKSSHNLNFEIKTHTSAKEKQEAKKQEFDSDMEVAESKIEDLTGAIAQTEAELNGATRIRSKESADFATSEKELMETIDTLSRAIGIISTEMSKNSAALAQIDSTSISTLMQSLSLVVEAAGVSSADQQKLVALVQSRQGDEELGAPASATYKSQSGGIVDVLEDLKDKADAELSDARKTETKSKNNFAMMKQTMEDQMAADTQDLNAAKSAKEDAGDEKAKMEGDLAVTIPDLKDDEASLEKFHQDCMQSAADHEATMAARKEEQTVLEQAKTILREATSGPLNKKDEMCECISRSCSTGTFSAEIKSHKDTDDSWGAWCFTRGNCNSLNQESVDECPGSYWARGPEGAFEPNRYSESQHEVANADKKDKRCQCASRSCSTGTFSAEIQPHDDANADWGAWCFTEGNCNSLNQQSVEECPGSYWARTSEGAFEPRKGEGTVIVEDVEATSGALDKKDEMCECVSLSCGTGTFSAEIKKHKDTEDAWGAWCFTRGNCNSLNQQSVEECPGNYWARSSEGAFEPQRTSHSLQEITNGGPDKEDKRCECTSQSCSTGTFAAEIQPHDDANPDWGAWCFTDGNCNSMNQKSVEECPGKFWARTSEGAFEPERTSKSLQEVTNGGPDKDDLRCQCVSKKCSTGTFSADIQPHDDANDDWGAWCFTDGDCNSMNQKSVEECPGSYWARTSEGAFAPQASSFLQLVSTATATAQTRAGLAHSEVAAMIKKLAHEQHSAALAQLASRIAVVAKYGGQDGADPFEKIKGLISEMVAKLEKAASSEETEKSYCDEQVAKTEAKKAELDFDVEKLVTKIHQAVARSAELQDESKLLHEEVALASKAAAELLKVRRKEHVNYLAAKGDLEQALASVRKASGLLRDYYGRAASMIQEAVGSGTFLEQPAKPQQHAKAAGAGANIIGILEVSESDFANGLSKEESEEADAEEEYQRVIQETKVSTASKESDLKYKQKEVVSLEKTVSELSSDKENLKSELSAVLQYFGRLKERCVAKPDTYEGRRARREAELNGLQEALSIIESQAAFMQKKRRMRGGVIAMQ